jgi:hypothetical protein
MSAKSAKGLYLVIQNQYEGIEALCHLTASRSEAVEKKKECAQKALRDEQSLYDEIKRDGKGPNPDPQEILDKFCIQHWNGKRFKCVCKESGIPPKRQMRR